MLAAVEDPMHACEELEGYASAHGKDDFYEQLSALMAGCDLAPAALSDALAPLADSARVETDQSDQQMEGPSSVAANTPASLADSGSAAGNAPALCAGQQDMCLTSVAGNAPTSLAGSASAAGSVPVFPSTAGIVSALGAKKVARKLQTSFQETLPTCTSDELGTVIISRCPSGSVATCP